VYYDVGYKTSIFTWRNARTAFTKAIKAANELR
jgi:hypothetical protein